MDAVKAGKLIIDVINVIAAVRNEVIANNKKSSDSGLTSSSGRDYPDGRSSPQGHVVSGYDRQQNGKKVQVKSYKRGGKPKKTSAQD